MGACTCHIPTLDTTPEADPGILKGGGGGSDGILANNFAYNTNFSITNNSERHM